MPTGVYQRAGQYKHSRSIALKRKPRSENFKKSMTGENNPFYGKHHTKETKQLLREKNIGRKHTPEELAKMSFKARGRKYSAETREKDRLAKLGNKSRLGIPHSEKTKKEMREAHLGQRMSEQFCKTMSIITKRNWQNPKFISIQMQARKTKPNKLEIQFDNFLNIYFPNIWKYVGDGQDEESIIGGKCPDWIHLNGKKQVIELFGSYWHPEIFCEAEKINHYKQYGFGCLVIWDNELKNTERTISKIKKFMIRKPRTEALGSPFGGI